MRRLARPSHMIAMRFASGNGTGVCDVLGTRLAGKAP